MNSAVAAANSASQRWNREMMSPARDSSVVTPIRLRYAILSTPRSGSTLLARMLYQTAQAGDPHEYLNPSAIRAWQELSGRNDTPVGVYMKDIEQRRTSANGCFGMKVHYFHLSRLSNSEQGKRQIAIQFVRQLDRRILITRRDKIAQAVSYFIAQQSGNWTSEHIKHLPQEPVSINFDAAAISRCLHRIVDDEEGWRKTLSFSGLPYLELVFEDVIKAYGASMQHVFAHLGIDPPETAARPALAPTTHPQAHSLAQQYRSYLGCD
jgi:LPS sulfotransferase NodH